MFNFIPLFILMTLITPKAFAMDLCAIAYEQCMRDCDALEDFDTRYQDMCYRSAAFQYQECKPEKKITAFTCGGSKNVIDCRFPRGDSRRDKRCDKPVKPSSWPWWWPTWLQW